MGGEMGGQAASHAQGMGRVLPTRPDVIRGLLVEHADPGIVEQYDSEWDEAYARCQEFSSPEPLFGFIRRWGFEAVNWQNAEKHQAYKARVESLLRNGPAPAEQRRTREQVRAAWEERHGRPFAG